MSANAAQTGRSISLVPAPWTAISLSVIGAFGLLITLGILTKHIGGGDLEQAVAGDAVAAAAAPGLPPSVLLEALRALVKELAKQAVDQAGHLLIGAVPILLSRQLTGLPWYGWAMVPLLAYREWLQWPSSRWWDPPLDWMVLALGVIVATWAIRSHLTPRRPPLAAGTRDSGPVEL
jgi:hypothetical protein